MNSFLKSKNNIISLMDYFFTEFEPKYGEARMSFRDAYIFYKIDKIIKMQEIYRYFKGEKKSGDIFIKKYIYLGLIEKSQSENDKRRRVLTLTQKGIAFKNKMIDIIDYSIEKSLYGLTYNDCLIIEKFLNNITKIKMDL